jgi:Ca-activated chloride channel family protein
MSLRTWFATPRVRRGLSASVVVIAAGGLVLLRTPADARVSPDFGVETTRLPAGPNTVRFSGPGAHGTLAVSHTRVLAGGGRMFAELRMVADQAEAARERAPLSMVVVLDTSGSMEGEKIQQAKSSVTQLIRDMRDDDEIALVRYSDSSEVLQPLARVGSVRSALIDKVESIRAGGGTNIAPALSHGMRAIDEVAKGRVRRVVLVSDGLDNTRVQSESVARTSAAKGITVSTMGIGLDFDEGYMSSVAQVGHGNFAFVKDGQSLAAFLVRELKEGASTTVESATARIKLPRGVQLVRAIGADATMNDGEMTVRMGSLFAGDERRVVIELATQLEVGETSAFQGAVSWDRVGGGATETTLDKLELSATTSPAEVDASRDGAVFASATSALASIRQLEAADAYARGDGARAQQLIQQNVSELRAAAPAAPAAERAALERQEQAYAATSSAFAGSAPTSAEGKAKAKASVANDSKNLGRKGF